MQAKAIQRVPASNLRSGSIDLDSFLPQLCAVDRRAAVRIKYKFDEFPGPWRR